MPQLDKITFEYQIAVFGILFWIFYMHLEVFFMPRSISLNSYYKFSWKFFVLNFRILLLKLEYLRLFLINSFFKKIFIYVNVK